VRNVGVPKTSPEVASLDPAKPSQPEPALLYAHLAMCEYTLIQSHDDLKCAQTLLGEGHYPQAVFMCSQSVEKSLDWSPGSRFHYYVDSYPGVVFTKDVAKIAYAIAKEIFRMTEIIHEENIQNFNEQ